VSCTPPPKIVWLRIGNCTTQEAAQVLLDYSEAIRAFAAHEDAAFFAIG
jgi:predicted nuclease of predicted toxin-antitoxin system